MLSGSSLNACLTRASVVVRAGLPLLAPNRVLLAKILAHLAIPATRRVTVTIVVSQLTELEINAAATVVSVEALASR